MEAVLVAAAEFVGNARDLGCLFSTSKYFRETQKQVLLPIRVAGQRRRDWKDWFTNLAQAFNGVRQIEVSDCNLSAADVVALLERQDVRLDTISIFRCFGINRMELSDVLKSNIKSIALGTITFSAHTLQNSSIFDNVRHLSFVNCTFEEQFHQNGLLIKLLGGQLPSLEVLTLGGSVYNAGYYDLTTQETKDAARSVVARCLEMYQNGGYNIEKPQEIICEITYARITVLNFLQEASRQLVIQRHPIHIKLVNLSADPLWAIQPLAELPVSVKRAVFTVHPGSGRKSILHEVAITGDAERAQWLIENGALLDVKDGFGCSPLMRAVEHNNIACVELLLAKGADIWASNHNREGPVYYAALRGYTTVLNKLLHQIELRESITGAALGEKIDAVCVDAKQFTPLHAAIIRQSKGCMETLLDAGCSAQQVNGHGQQALHIAAAIFFSAGVELLLSLNVDVNAADGMGMTPLDYVQISKHRRQPAPVVEDVVDNDELKESDTSDTKPQNVTQDAPAERIDLEAVIIAAGGTSGKHPKRRQHRKRRNRGST